jgi:hypothetical protein
VVAVTCPFCDSGDVERVARWGGQIITAQWRCQACNSYFEAVREDFDEVAGGDGPGQVAALGDVAAERRR